MQETIGGVIRKMDTQKESNEELKIKNSVTEMKNVFDSSLVGWIKLNQ